MSEIPDVPGFEFVGLPCPCGLLARRRCFWFLVSFHSATPAVPAGSVLRPVGH